jgi:hypothetical protein
MRQKLAFVSMKMGNPISAKGVEGSLGKPPIQGSRRSEAKPTIPFQKRVKKRRSLIIISLNLKI